MSKTSNVYARIEPETKEQAEAILSKLGILSIPRIQSHTVQH